MPGALAGIFGEYASKGYIALGKLSGSPTTALRGSRLLLRRVVSAPRPAAGSRNHEFDLQNIDLFIRIWFAVVAPLGTS